MDEECNTLLQNIFNAGSIPVSNTVESQRLMGELMQRGLVEISRTSGQSADSQPFRSTVQVLGSIPIRSFTADEIRWVQPR